jgi:hypothetical protein
VEALVFGGILGWEAAHGEEGEADAERAFARHKEHQGRQQTGALRLHALGPRNGANSNSRPTPIPLAQMTDRLQAPSQRASERWATADAGEQPRPP